MDGIGKISLKKNIVFSESLLFLQKNPAPVD